MRSIRHLALPLTLAAALAAASVLAQPAPGYTGPSANPPQAQTQAPASGYTGPSSVQLLTVKQLLDTGKDDQHARLQGRIVSHDGGDTYTFADDTGRITAEIKAKHFPAGQTVSAEQRVELLGEFDKGFRKTEFEVDAMTLLR